MKIAVAGTGYVGLSLAVYLSQKNKVCAYDINQERIKLINQRKTYFKDEYIEMFFKKENDNLEGTMDYKKAFKDAEYIIICTPTNYDEKTNFFDTSSVEDVIKKSIEINPKSTIIIKSTIPIGFTDKVREKYNKNNIIFSPEFLREGNALHDCFFPSRIVVGDTTEEAIGFGKIMKELVMLDDVKTIYTNSKEAESIKLFANTYLALRVAFFNELDTFCELNGITTEKVIEGICNDPRIGNYYNNPSFGYGGYCLPKDTKQLLANYQNIPQNLIEAIIKSNETRKNHIVNMLLKKGGKTIGIYKLAMKADSDNYRESAILSIIDKLKEKGIEVLIYEPSINEEQFRECKIVDNLEELYKNCDIIAVNREDENIIKYKDKIYTRTISNKD